MPMTQMSIDTPLNAFLGAASIVPRQHFLTYWLVAARSTPVTAHFDAQMAFTGLMTIFVYYSLKYFPLSPHT